MKTKLFDVAGIVALVLLFLAIVTGQANAQTAANVCGPRADVLANLFKNYQEVPVNIGLTVDGRAIEVLVSPAGTFTFIKTSPNGLSCLVDTGQNWENVKPLKPKGAKI